VERAVCGQQKNKKKIKRKKKLTIEVSIIRACARHVHADTRVGQNPDVMRHQRVLVQRRLAIKQHDIAVNKVALNSVPNFNVDFLGAA